MLESAYDRLADVVCLVVLSCAAAHLLAQAASKLGFALICCMHMCKFSPHSVSTPCCAGAVRSQNHSTHFTQPSLSFNHHKRHALHPQDNMQIHHEAPAMPCTRRTMARSPATSPMPLTWSSSSSRSRSSPIQAMSLRCCSTERCARAVCGWEAGQRLGGGLCSGGFSALVCSTREVKIRGRGGSTGWEMGNCPGLVTGIKYNHKYSQARHFDLIPLSILV